MTCLIVMAMRAEAEPLVSTLDLESIPPRAEWPHTEWHTSPDRSIVIAVNGADPVHRVDSIGTVPAALTTLLSIDEWDPTWVISAGTAGGFVSRGGHIGQVIVADGMIVHHDRRIPLGAFEAFGRGEHPTADLSALATALGFTPGPCSSGDSLDAPPLDMAIMTAHGTLAKDMEAAAVAGVANRMGRRFTALKVITDLVDGPVATTEEFSANLHTASQALADALPRFVEGLPD